MIPQEDMFWPFEAFFYVLPFRYYVSASGYNFLQYLTWEECTDPTTSAVCVDPPTTENVLNRLSVIFGSLLSSEDTIVRDMCVLVVIAMFYKILYAIGVMLKCRRSAKIYPDSALLEI